LQGLEPSVHKGGEGRKLILRGNLREGKKSCGAGGEFHGYRWLLLYIAAAAPVVAA
jgi:hypothetical protein